MIQAIVDCTLARASLTTTFLQSGACNGWQTWFLLGTEFLCYSS